MNLASFLSLLDKTTRGVYTAFSRMNAKNNHMEVDGNHPVWEGQLPLPGNVFLRRYQDLTNKAWPENGRSHFLSVQ